MNPYIHCALEETAKEVGIIINLLSEIRGTYDQAFEIKFVSTIWREAAVDFRCLLLKNHLEQINRSGESVQHGDQFRTYDTQAFGEPLLITSLR